MNIDQWIKHHKECNRNPVKFVSTFPVISLISNYMYVAILIFLMSEVWLNYPYHSLVKESVNVFISYQNYNHLN